MKSKLPFTFYLSFIFLFFCLNNSHAQQVTDAVLAKTIKQFVGMGYIHQRTIQPVPLKAGIIPEQLLSCYSGKEVLIAAIYNKKPLKAFARMIVQKKHGGQVSFDKHIFQPVEFDVKLKIYYSLISVLFPEEATFKNCSTNVQVYDEKAQASKVWLLVFTK